MKKTAKESPLIANLDVYILLLIINLVVFAQVRSFEFTSYDDLGYIYNNVYVKAGLRPSNIVWAFTTTLMGHWHPLTWLSYFTDMEVYGLRPGGFHITNLIIHIFNTLMVFWLFNKSTGTKWRSTAVAALFAIHPLHVESVAWVADRKDLLSAFWGLVALNIYVQYVKDISWPKYILIVIAFGLSLMSKAMLVTLPAIFILLDYWPLNRFEKLVKPRINIWGQVKFQIKEKGLLFLMSGIIVIVASLTVRTQSKALVAPIAKSVLEQIRADRAHFPRFGILLAPYHNLYYLAKTFWPIDLFAPYPIEFISFKYLMLGVLGLLLISIAMFWLGRYYGYAVIGWLWFVGGLVPVANLPQLSDRYTYMPLIGIFIIISWGSYDLFTKYLNLTLLKAAAVIALVILCLISWVQTDYWRDSETLYKHALSIYPDNVLVHYNYGIILGDNKEFEKAKVEFQKTVDLKPDLPEGLFNLGKCYANLGKYDEAMEYYKKTLELKPEYAEVYCNMGKLIGHQGGFAESIPYYKKALELKPDYQEPFLRLKEAQELVEKQKQKQALVEKQKQALVEKQALAEKQKQ